MRQVRLGYSGVAVSELGFGTGTHGIQGASDQTNLGCEKLSRLLRYAFERGIDYWDTADAYGSHHYIADTLRGMTRSDVVISTKTDSRSPMDVSNDVNRFLAELRVDYVDMLMLHCIINEDWLTDYRCAIEVLKEAKAKKKARAIGISCHAYEALKRVPEAEWLDVLIARFNWAGSNMDAPVEAVANVLRQVHQQGKGVIAIKVLGDGELADDVDRAIQWMKRQEYVDAMIIGMTDGAQVDQNVDCVERPDEAAEGQSLENGAG